MGRHGSPLPAGTVLGHENFTDSLWIDGRCVTIQLLHNGTAGIEYIYDDQADSEHFLFFGDRMITSEDRDQIVYGEHHAPLQRCTPLAGAPCTFSSRVHLI